MSSTNSILNIQGKSYYEVSPKIYSEFSIITIGDNNFVLLGSSYIYITSPPSNIKTSFLQDDIPPDNSIFIYSDLMRTIPPDKTNSTSYNYCNDSKS